MMFNIRFYLLWVLLFVLTVSWSASAQIWREYEQSARKAYQNKDIAAFVSSLEQALVLKPNHTRLMHNLAIGYAVQGRYDAALENLRKVAATGMVFPVATNPAFALLKDSTPFKARFDEVVKRFAASLLPVGKSVKAIELPEKALLTESIAYDPHKKAFYVGAVHKRKVVTITADGTIRDFSKPSDSLWSVLGMKVDAKRRKLWVCTAALPQMQGFDSSVQGHSALCVFDLKTGRLLRRYYAPNDARAHAFGDLTLHPTTGVPLVSDSKSPTIFTISPINDTLQIWLQSDGSTLPSLQGIDFTADGTALFVADYANGIIRIDVRRKTLQRLPHPDRCVVTGTDGLYRAGGDLVGIQNGTFPHRVVRFRLNKAQTAIQGLDVVAANHPLFDEPTLGVMVGSVLYFVANSQWEKVDERGIAHPETAWQLHAILKCTLPK